MALCEDDFVTLFEGHDGFLPIGGPAGLASALAAGFAWDVHGIDLDDLDLKKLLHCLANLRFVRATIRYHRVLVELIALAGALFSQPGGFDDFKSVHT